MSGHTTSISARENGPEAGRTSSSDPFGPHGTRIVGILPLPDQGSSSCAAIGPSPDRRGRTGQARQPCNPADAIDGRGIGTARIGVDFNLMVDQIDDPVDRHSRGGIDSGLVHRSRCSDESATSITRAMSADQDVDKIVALGSSDHAMSGSGSLSVVVIAD